jgi:peptidoglycan/LPS O-acetylase OafA/YrhL
MQTLQVLTLVLSATLPMYVSRKLLLQQGSITNFTGTFDPSQMIIVESFFILVPLLVYLSRFAFANGRRFREISFLLGGITYPLYLLHWKIGDTIISRYQEYTKVTPLSISFAAGLIGVSYFLSVYELPVRKFLKAKIETIL